MGVADILPWLGILNVLIIPGLMLIIGLRDEIRSASGKLDAHAVLDEQRFSEHRRDLDRHEREIGAAHSRLDEIGAERPKPRN